MSHTLSEVRELPNHELYKLKLAHVGSPTIIVAVLTQKALDLGVRFDNDRKDYQFNLSDFLGVENGNWGRGADFDSYAKNIKLDLSDRENRYLIADLKDSDGQYRTGKKYNLDDNLGLVDYFHSRERMTYFRLGAKSRGSSKRTLVLCFDGTSNHFSSQNTNVVKFFELLKKDNPEQQMVYYQTGVGTYTSPAWTSSISQGVAKTADLAVAWYLHQHVCDGYKFLMESYQDGDRIYIFGFSRGAYTARALAGMLHCVGLLPRHNVEHIPFAYQIYASQQDPNSLTPDRPTEVESNSDSDETLTDDLELPDTVPDTEVSEEIVPCNSPLVGNPPSVPPPNNPLKRRVLEGRKQFGGLGSDGNSKAKDADPEAYKQTFCTPIVIDFVGVWDTVGSLGALLPQTLPYINYNPSIKIFRHALALDEHRANFVPSLWDHARTVPGQNVREVWFRGQHTDIGGGAPSPTGAPGFSALSNISLRWMVQQCLENMTLIAFDGDAMALYREANVLEHRPVQPDLLKFKENIKQAELESKEKKLRAVAEAMSAARAHRARLYDASSKLDQIDIKHEPFEAAGTLSPWNILELFPSTRPIQTANGPTTTRVPNFGKTRMIYRRKPSEPVFIHASVIDFILTPEGNKYIPGATWDGFNDGDLPRIESYEGNQMSWPDSGPNRTALVSAMNMNWKPVPGMLDRFKSGVTSIGSKVGRLVGFA
ncbi:CVNH domain protein [Rhizoctonia solani AG-3 Rhs1AP]|uniref:CVNH domain protein n=1 Tax=Rhizoctonia solani AG-3 Rhs1AP TaxID=1086054 RepID=X8J9M3_9AGAM|nr:CVNH domain protein [Rhizoctonia solani AG-3 Rhs1AP]